MKKLFAVLAFVLLTTAVFAQEDETPDPNHGRADCRTIEQSNNLAAEAGIKVFMTLRSVDLGFQEPTDAVIYTDGQEYVAIAFVSGCAYAAHQFKDDAELAKFVNANTKQADHLTPL